jgi:uracil-DNA glycosylase family 4
MNEESFEKKRTKYFEFLKAQPKGFVYRDTETKRKDPSATPSAENKTEKLKTLNCKYTSCQACPLGNQGRTQVVFGKGSAQATLMFVGEGPGKDEDTQGAPFVGRSGKLLTQIIEAMGLTRDDVYISNVVKCRPPENRTPLPNESSTCKDLLLLKEIDIVQPKIICTLGATATKALLGDDAKITASRGMFVEWRGLLVLPTYHPAYLLRNPAEKRTVWEDMKKIMAKLEELANNAQQTKN